VLFANVAKNTLKGGEYGILKNAQGWGQDVIRKNGILEHWVYEKTLLFSSHYSIIPVFQEFF